MKRRILFVLAWVCVGLGAVGAFLPVMPTAPFIILAAFLFSKSSERFHNWLLEHQVFGPTLRDWEREGAIKLQTKWITSFFLACSYLMTKFIFGIREPIPTISAVIFASVLIYIWTRPNPNPLTSSSEVKDSAE